jgi:hypothetical protein
MYIPIKNNAVVTIKVFDRGINFPTLLAASLLSELLVLVWPLL